MSRDTWLLGGAVLLSGLVAASLYTLEAREVAVVTAFGAPVRTVTQPGLYLRAPWPLHEVVRFDSRVHLFAVEATEVLTRDKKNLVVEAFVAWRISDPGRFLESVGSAEAAEIQLSDQVVSRVAAALGQRDFGEMVSADDTVSPLLPDSVQQKLSEVADQQLGIEVLELQLQRLGFPIQNEQSIYERMRAERQRIANAYRSEGEEKAAAIRAEADREASEVLSLAERESAGIRARADGQAAKLYAESYAQDPDFFLFLRRLEAAEAVLGEDDLVVLSEDAPLFTPLVEGR